MEAISVNTVQISHDAPPRSPRTRDDSQDGQPLPTDSMVTVPLSETDGTHAMEHDEDDDEEMATLQQPRITIDEKRLSSRPTSAELMQAIRERDSRDGSIRSSAMNSPTISLPEEDTPQTPTSGERPRSNSGGSNESAHVDWAELEKAEEQEPQEEGQDDVSFFPLRIIIQLLIF